MEMTPSDYEKLVATIAESVAKQFESSAAVAWGRRNLWLGASGFEHQIDVSVKGQTRVLLVECKYWSECIPVQAALVLVARLADIRPKIHLPVEGAIISTVGFDPGVKQISDHFGIHYDIVRSVEEWAFKYAGNIVITPLPASVVVEAVIDLKVQQDDRERGNPTAPESIRRQ